MQNQKLLKKKLIIQNKRKNQYIYIICIKKANFMNRNR